MENKTRQFICTWDNGTKVTYSTEQDKLINDQILVFSNNNIEFDRDSSDPNYKLCFREAVGSYLFECDRKREDFTIRSTGMSHIYLINKPDCLDTLIGELARCRFVESYPPKQFPIKVSPLLSSSDPSDNKLPVFSSDDQTVTALAYIIYTLCYRISEGKNIWIICEQNNMWKKWHLRLAAAVLSLSCSTMPEQIMIAMSDSILPQKGNVKILSSKFTYLADDSNNNCIKVHSSRQNNNTLCMTIDSRYLYWSKLQKIYCIHLADRYIKNCNYQQELLSFFEKIRNNKADAFLKLSFIKSLNQEPHSPDSVNQDDDAFSVICSLLNKNLYEYKDMFQIDEFANAAVLSLNKACEENNILKNARITFEKMVSVSVLPDDKLRFLTLVFDIRNRSQCWYYELFKVIYRKNPQAARQIDEAVIREAKNNGRGLKRDEICIIPKFNSKKSSLSLKNFISDFDRLGLYCSDKPRRTFLVGFIVDSMMNAWDPESILKAWNEIKGWHPGIEKDVANEVKKQLDAIVNQNLTEHKLDTLCQLLSKHFITDNSRLTKEKIWQSIEQVAEGNIPVGSDIIQQIHSSGNALGIDHKSISQLIKHITTQDNQTAQSSTVGRQPSSQSGKPVQHNKSENSILKLFALIITAFILNLAALIKFAPDLFFRIIKRIILLLR